ncbi:amino acid adenylation domain-containing protein [Flavobacterium araucananum]|uniref:Non-ribosomal peptide synthetase n=1 Tax=Flavobacterium araucananum TaxID=946678 RepID=A0A227PHW6_9FLAO|nr:non-ribosomal peptide synthetase [Flavobacterium araucananum]OXG09133.1 non-ribosomal peptide synthetase [Flavobacterium araucananum]PWJ99671.1 amino acid adenylation domain-containing protein [Flavobacterium araucananum]
MKLTLPQQDVYFEHLLYPSEPIHNIGAKIEIKGVIDIEIFKKAYHELINQHDAYRSTLVNDQEYVTIKIAEEHHTTLGFVDFSGSEDASEKANFYMQEEFSKPFDLFGEHLLHTFTVVKVTRDFHYLFSVYHHLITDGWGTSLMFQRLVQNYNEIFEFGEVRTVYPFSYKDFIEDDLLYQNSESYTQNKNYWVHKFESLPENLFEKTDDTLPANKSDRKELIVKREIYNQLNTLASQYKCSTFNLILGVLYAYFGRKHQNNDFAIGLPVLNRSKSNYKKTVGLFMGVTPLRIAVDFDATVEELLTDIKNQLRYDYRHQRFPLGKLIQELRLFNEKERLFNITLSYEKQNYSSDFKNTQTSVIPLTHKSERVALAIYIREFDELEDVKIDFDYNLSYFNEAQIAQVVAHFENLLTDLLNHPEKKLKELDYLSPQEENQLLKTFNNTESEYPKQQTVIDLFELQVQKSPGKEALKDDYKSYSYSELDKISSQIAEQIIGVYGKKDKSPIAVLLGRSANMVVVLLAILKSGRSYIPLDPAFPKDRLRYIIDNSACKVLIIEKEYQLEVLDDVAVVPLENILEGINDFKGIISKKTLPTDTAYIIYTSGSTGNPKGVEIGHRSLVNFLTSIIKEPGVKPADILFSVTTYSFDISILEFFVPLLSGATLYIADQNTLADPNLIIKKLEEIKPTIIQATPSFYQMLFNAQWQGDKQLKVMCGGDLLSEALAEKLIFSTMELWNMYGPTETTIWSSIKRITHPAEASNIGKPIHNTRFYILDQFFSPMPIGTAGAIYIAGDGLAKGYYKNELLTTQKFIANPFDANTLLYETGDVGKWNNKGEIEFLGRNDNQVKIRGYRIELGDVEAQLNQISGIKEAVVIAKKESQQEAFLVAYILKTEEEIDTEKIISVLKINLPYYMIPNAIIDLEEFPLTPNKKIDRKALMLKSIQVNIKQDDYKAPVSDLEKTLATYWKQVLDRTEDISTKANFFSLGGHSLNAVRLIGLISQELSFAITLKPIFDHPTIESLAQYLQVLKVSVPIEIPVSEPKSFYCLTPSQHNIWLASQQTNTSIAYNMSAGYSIHGAVDLEKMIAAINAILYKYQILRTNFIEIEGIPYQKINAFDKEKFKIINNKLKPENLAQAIDQFINTEFNLETDLLIRVELIQVETGQILLLFSTHHIIMDGFSLEIFTREFIKNYNEKHNPSEFLGEDALKFQFKDYAEWFNQALKDDVFDNELVWEKYLHGYQKKASFDQDFSSDNNQQNGSKHLFELDPEVTIGLKEVAFAKKVTLYTVLAAALNVLIFKISNHTDICIGTVNSGRNSVQLNDQIGMFVKTHVLRTQIGSDQDFDALLQNTQENLLLINDYQSVPFDQLHASLFDVMLVYQNPEFSFENINEFNDLKLTSYNVDNKYSRIPIVFNVFESNGKLKGIIDYNADLYDPETIAIIAQKYCNLLSQIAQKSVEKIDLIDVKLDFEKNVSFDFDFNF